MIRNTFLSLLFLSFWLGISEAQTTITAQINSSSDDAEEYFYTPANDAFRTDGSMDLVSSDIELGAEERNGKNPQISGLRFNSIDIPAGALILSAYIDFTVDAFNKNEDPANYYIYAENNTNPSTFTTDAYNITSRPFLNDSVSWNLIPGSWSSVGQKGTDQHTSDIKQLVQQLVNNGGWTSGNSMAFFIKGIGVREAESFDGNAPEAARFVVRYITVSSITSQIASSTDDAEEYFYTPANDAFRTDGSMDIVSSDIELGAEERNGKNPQVSGLRFTNLAVPKGAQIQSAYIQFTVDAINKNQDPAVYTIHAEDNASPATFTTSLYNISTRNKLTDSVVWNIATGSWNVVGSAGVNEQTPDIKTLIQQIVNKAEWVEGNSIALFISGTGVREAESFDGSPLQAARLMINFIPVAGVTSQIASSGDDAEEYIYTPANDAFRTDGSMDIVSSDIELGAEERSGKNPQISGLRFTNLAVPAGAQIINAYIQFTVDAINKNEDPANYFVFAEDNINPSGFATNAYNISTRLWLNDSVAWNVPAGSWNVVGEAGVIQQTSTLNMLVQELVNKPGWAEGNSMAFFIKGTGVREAESFDGSAAQAARLVIEYLQGTVELVPELVKEIPDQELVQGWDIALDLKPYFTDKDSEIALSASITGRDSLPQGISLENGILRGTYNNVDSFFITVTATSEGESISDEFTLNYLAPSGNFTLSILHNNDGESKMLPDSITVNGVRTVGGSISQFKTTLESLRNQAELRDYPSIMLSSGDNFLAGLEYNASTANGVFYDAIALDSIDYDAIALGNHDFDFGTTVLANLINAIKVNKAPYLSSNLSFQNVPELKALADSGRIKPSTIIELNGQQIGVIGLTTPLLPIISSPGNTIVSEAIVDSVQKQINILNTLGINKIILISHLQSYQEDLALAAQLSGIDIIIAGGGDELLANDPDLGDPYNAVVVGPYPVIARDRDSNNVYLVTTPGNYRYVGNLIVDFDSIGEVTKVYQSDPVLVTGASDNTLKAQIEDPITAYIGELSTNVIAVAQDTLDFRREKLRGEESNGGNLFADALLWQAKKTYANFGVKEPQVAIQNSGGLRIESLINPGNFTEDLTYRIAAFTNIVCVVEDISPAKFLELIEHGVARAPMLDGRFPQIAGFEIVYDPLQPAGNRVISIKLDNGTYIVNNGNAVDGAPYVNLATIDFTANGGDGYPFAPLTYKTLGATYQQAFRNYLAETDGLDSLIQAAQYPFTSEKFRIKTEITQIPAVLTVNESFNSSCPALPAGWVEYNSATDLINCGGSNNYIEFNGYAKGAGTSWLITPRVALNTGTYALSFDHTNQFSGPQAEVLYSTNYSGIGDPSAATWTSIPAATSIINSNTSSTLINSGEINISSIQQEAYIAFRYQSLGTSSGQSTRLRLDNVKIDRAVIIIDHGFLPISQIQGDSIASPYVDGIASTSGIVTAVFNGNEPYTGAGFSSNLKGFYIQDVIGDTNALTSEGIFISSTNAVSVGDSIVVKGLVKETYGLTQLANIAELQIRASGLSTPASTVIDLPLLSENEFEIYEGMLVTFADELYVTENRNLENFGELRLSAEGLLYQPTQLIDPNDNPSSGNSSTGGSNVAAVNDFLNNNKAKSIILDDARDGSYRMPVAYINNNTLVAGSKINNLTGILSYGFAMYRIQPTQAPQFTYANRATLPEFENATLKVASFNVLNYFNGDGMVGGFPTSRGAATISDFSKQTKKIVAALSQMNADVVGLIEIENDANDSLSAIRALTDSLNAFYGTVVYDFIKTGTIGRNDSTADEIKVGFIYKPATVELVGNYKILNDNFSPDYRDDQNRPALAQTFMEKASGEVFTAVVNHFKSKGSDCNAIGDPDNGDGQGNCSGTRTLAAQTLASWLATDPTGSKDDDFIILGDLNSYAQEDPIDMFRSLGYINLHNDSAYSYVFDGQYGTLDYALVNESLFKQVTESHIWHINSVEPDMLAYNGLSSMFEPTPYWSSDHDPAIVGLKLKSLPKIESFTLIDAKGNPISTLQNGSVIDYRNLTDDKVNILATVNGKFSYVTLKLTGKESAKRTDNSEPVTLFANHWKPLTGKYKLIATPYKKSGKVTEAGEGLSIEFTVAFNTTVNSFTLINAISDSGIIELSNNSIIDCNQTGNKLNIRGNVDGYADYVTFLVLGKEFHYTKEKFAPYAVFGDIEGDYTSWNPDNGNYQLYATPYLNKGAKSISGTTKIIGFKVINNKICFKDAEVELTDSQNIGDYLTQNKFVAYPNPVSDKLFIQITGKEFSTVKINVVSLTGQVLINQQFNNVTEQTLEISTEGLTQGIYQLQVWINDSIQIIPLIKQ